MKMEELECGICLTKLDDVVIKMDCCKLTVHKKCIDIWLENNNNCPKCRRKVIESECLCFSFFLFFLLFLFFYPAIVLNVLYYINFNFTFYFFG